MKAIIIYLLFIQALQPLHAQVFNLEDSTPDNNTFSTDGVQLIKNIRSYTLRLRELNL